MPSHTHTRVLKSHDSKSVCVCVRGEGKRRVSVLRFDPELFLTSHDVEESRLAAGLGSLYSSDLRNTCDTQRDIYPSRRSPPPEEHGHTRVTICCG